jgi:hypothetical protein
MSATKSTKSKTTKSKATKPKATKAKTTKAKAKATKPKTTKSTNANIKVTIIETTESKTNKPNKLKAYTANLKANTKNVEETQHAPLLAIIAKHVLSAFQNGKVSPVNKKFVKLATKASEEKCLEFRCTTWRDDKTRPKKLSTKELVSIVASGPAFKKYLNEVANNTDVRAYTFVLEEMVNMLSNFEIENPIWL